MSWCHLAQYLSSKVLGYIRLKAPCIALSSLSNSYALSRVHARAKRARAHARPFRRYSSQAHKRRRSSSRYYITCCRRSSRDCGKVENNKDYTLSRYF
nr:MAG TPA: hypothetical protein [Microviridae sp.]